MSKNTWKHAYFNFRLIVVVLPCSPGLVYELVYYTFDVGLYIPQLSTIVFGNDALPLRSAYGIDGLGSRAQSSSGALQCVRRRAWERIEGHDRKNERRLVAVQGGQAGAPIPKPLPSQPTKRPG